MEGLNCQPFMLTELYYSELCINMKGMEGFSAKKTVGRKPKTAMKTEIFNPFFLCEREPRAELLQNRRRDLSSDGELRKRRVAQHETTSHPTI